MIRDELRHALRSALVSVRFLREGEVDELTVEATHAFADNYAISAEEREALLGIVAAFRALAEARTASIARFHRELCADDERDVG